MLGRVDASTTLLSLTRSLDPSRHSVSHLAFEDFTKGAVAVETTLLSQLPGRKRTMTINSLVIEADKMIDAQTIDIGIVSHS